METNFCFDIIMVQAYLCGSVSSVPFSKILVCLILHIFLLLVSGKMTDKSRLKHNFIILINVLLSTGVVGMVLSYGLSLNMLFLFSIQNQCSLANQIISVERLSQYMHIASEAPGMVEDNQLPADWPSVGKIELHGLEASDDKIFHTAVPTDLISTAFSCFIQKT